MGPAEVMIALIVIGLPVITVFYGFHRFFKFREKKLEVEAMMTAEKAAQSPTRRCNWLNRIRSLRYI